MYTESFEKGSVAERNSSKGALFFQYMVMRNVQLTGLSACRRCTTMGEGKEREYSAILQTTWNYLYSTS